MFADLFLGSVLAVFLTLGVVRGDAESGLLQPITVRPIGRSTFLLARFAGAAALSAAYVIAIYALAVLITELTGHWSPDHLVGPALGLALGVSIVAALSLLGSVYLSSTAQGIAVLMRLRRRADGWSPGADRPGDRLLDVARDRSSSELGPAIRRPLRSRPPRPDLEHRRTYRRRPSARSVRRVGAGRTGARRLLRSLHGRRPRACRPGLRAARSLSRRTIDTSSGHFDLRVGVRRRRRLGHRARCRGGARPHGADRRGRHQLVGHAFSVWRAAGQVWQAATDEVGAPEGGGPWSCRPAKRVWSCAGRRLDQSRSPASFPLSGCSPAPDSVSPASLASFASPLSPASPLSLASLASPASP